eukprot:360870-Chlamydomonas_euryale.AAC.16
MSASGATYAAVPQLLNGKLEPAPTSSSSTRLSPKSVSWAQGFGGHTSQAGKEEDRGRVSEGVGG